MRIFPDRGAQKPVEHAVRSDERVDAYVLVAVVRQRSVPGAEVHGVDPARREVRHVRPGLLRLEREVTGSPEGAHGR